VRLGIFDATADGQIVINESDMFKSGNDLAAAGDVRSSTATGPSFNPRKKEHTRRTMSFIMKEVLIDFANSTTMSPYPLHSGFWGTMSPL
jgi:hypothetical protein